MVEIKELCKVYKDDAGKTVALAGINFKLPTKGMVFIVGKSGCGKTTLLNVIGGLDNFSSGDVIIHGKKMSEFSIPELDNYRNNTIGFVFQDFCLIDRMNVIDNIKLSLEFQNNKTKVNYKGLLKRFGLEGLGRRKPKQLSAGQKQRVAIARAIVKNPEMILADEPTGNVDEKTSKQILELLKEISQERLVVIISHNLEEAYEFADRIIEMSDGKVVSDRHFNPRAKAEIVIDDKKTIIPEHGVISDEELIVINNKVNNSQGAYQITQSSEKFIEKPFKDSGEKIHLRQSEMSNKSKFKYAGFFFGKKIIFNTFIILLLTFITALFAIVEILGFCDCNTELRRISAGEGYKELCYYGLPEESSYGSYQYHVNEEKINTLADKYSVDVECVYNINISLYAKTQRKIMSYRQLYSSTEIASGYLKETNGVVITTENNLKRRFGGIEVLAGQIKTNGTGVIITDYVADSILFHASDEYQTYQDILDKDYVSDTLHVDAIIKGEMDTSIVDEMKKTKEVSYLNQLLTTEAYCYTLNPNFMEDYTKEMITTPYAYSQTRSMQFIMPGEEIPKSLTWASGTYDSTLKENEIKMSYYHFNYVYGTNYTKKNYETDFVPTKITIKLIDSAGNGYFEQEVLFTSLFERQHNYDVYRVSDKLYNNFMSNERFACAVTVFVDTKNADYQMYDFLKEAHLESKNSEILMVNRTIELFDVFNSVFRYIAYLLIISIFLIIALNANIIIKHNVYEIGLMKAFGAKTKELVIIFTIQMIITSIAVCILSYFTSQIAIIFADELLVNGIQAYMGSGNQYEIDYNSFEFNIWYFVLNISVISVSTIISVIVPILSIRNIKPLKIIKTRN